MGRAPVAILLLAAFAAGCDSSDDGDDPMTEGPGTEMPGPGDMNGGPAATTLAEVLDRGPTDEPVSLDGTALASDLESVLGGTDGEPLEGDDIDTVVGGGGDASTTTGNRRIAN